MEGFSFKYAVNLMTIVILLSACTAKQTGKVDLEISIPQREFMKNPDLGNGYFLNPILPGDYPDPSILRDGEDYYMTHSSMEYAPGLLIWHSRDLVSWEPVCYALKKYVGSVYAPDFIKYKNLYYIYFPAVTKSGISNMVVTASKPEGPWSDPVDLKIGHIDPGHVVAPDGKRYLHLSDGYLVPLADDGLSVEGEMKKIYEGWQYPLNWLVEGFCLESPKLTLHHGYYYLTSAEGGTAGPATSHMVVSSRSKTPWGPWEDSPYNPVVHTYSASESWWSKGHATLVSAIQGDWWIVYHAYEKGYYNLGRQTILEPIEWTQDEWFRVKAEISTNEPIKKPSGESLKKFLKLSDDFSGTDLGLQWRFFREFDPDRFTQENNSLLLKAKGTSPADCSPLLCIAGHHAYEIETELVISGEATGGLILFYNDNLYCGIGLNKQGLIRYERGNPLVLNPRSLGNKIRLRIRNLEHQVSYFFLEPGKDWTMYEASSEVSTYNHNAFGGFMSLRAGLFSTGKGTVRFSYFKYTGLDGKNVYQAD